MSKYFFDAYWCQMASVHWVIIGSGNGLLPVWQKAFTWIISAILLIRPWWTYFNEILFEIQISSIKKFLIVVCNNNNKKTIKRLHFKLSYVRNRLFYSGLYIVSDCSCVLFSLTPGELSWSVYCMCKAHLFGKHWHFILQCTLQFVGCPISFGT